MAQEETGVESQNLTTKVVVLGLSAVFLTYFVTYFMTLGLSVASPMIAANLNGMALFSWAISIPALAMAFASNDLVNFIGVPLAGLHAYKTAIASGDPLTVTMGALSAKVQSQTFLLLIAGVIMVLTLWISKKARTV